MPCGMMENALTRTFSSASREKSAGTSPQEASSASSPHSAAASSTPALRPHAEKPGRKGPRGRHLRNHYSPSGLWPQRGVDSLRTDGLRLNIGVTQSSGPEQQSPNCQRNKPRRDQPAKDAPGGTCISPALIPDTHGLPPSMQLKREQPSPLAILLQFACRSGAKSRHPFQGIGHGGERWQ